MSKRWMMVAGALVLLCAAPSVVLAAAESVITVTMGQQTPTGPFSDIAKSGIMAGLTAGYRVTPWLAIGGEFAYFHSPGVNDAGVFDVFEPPTDTVKTVNMTLDENWSITELGFYGKLFVFERGRVCPYLRAGAGAYTLRYTQDIAASATNTTVGGNEQTSKVGFSFGGGARIRIVGGTSLGAEFLTHYIVARDTHVSLWTAGLTLGFGPTGN